MPCNSSYLEPSQEEENKVQVSKLIIYVDKKLGAKTRKEIIKASKHTYGLGVELDVIVPELCSKLKSLNKKQKEEIIYNAKNKTSRSLANWWEEHQKADKERIKFQKELKKKHDLKESALKKLTAEEIKALDIK